MEKQNWKKIEPQLWKPSQEGDVIEGVLVGKVRPKEGGIGISTRYYISNKEGAFYVWGTMLLDERLLFVSVGQTIKITYQGQEEYKENMLNLFQVEVAENVEADISDSNPTAEVKGKRVSAESAT